MKLADKLNAGETILTAWSTLASTGVVELLARADFDAVTLDMQHGAHTEESVHDGLLAIAASDKGAIVRIPVGRNDMVSRALDFGAEAIIAPMINSVEDARAFAAHAKYPPVGQRSWGPARALSMRGIQKGQDYLSSANEKTVAFAMIETRAALAALDDILACPGIDGVFVGPSDFSISWTNGAAVDPHHEEMTKAIADVARRAKAAGKHAGVFVFDAPRTQSYVKMGFNLLSVIHDGAYFSLGMSTMLDQARNG